MMAKKSGKGKPKYVLTSLALPKAGTVKVYASPRIAEALRELTEDMNLYKGVKLVQVLEAFYFQGVKEGRAEAARMLAETQKKLGQGRPGRPSK
jgi:hypothetical protein